MSGLSTRAETQNYPPIVCFSPACRVCLARSREAILTVLPSPPVDRDREGDPGLALALVGYLVGCGLLAVSTKAAIASIQVT